MLKIVEVMRASIDSLNFKSEVASLRNILYPVTSDLHVPIMANIANVSLYKYAVLPRVTGYTISHCLPNETKAEKRQGKYAENIRVFWNAESIEFSEEELNMWVNRIHLHTPPSYATPLASRSSLPSTRSATFPHTRPPLTVSSSPSAFARIHYWSRL